MRGEIKLAELLADRIALVTGASKGIGQSIAIELAREGADVIINYNSDKDGALNTKSAIENLGRKVLVVQADISELCQIEHMFKLIKKDFKKLDILVNNAGIALWAPFFDITEEVWDKTINTNLKGVFFCSQMAAKIMSKNNRGSIINISSIAAYGAMDCLVPYCCSKGGLTLLTKCMAAELSGYNIRVNAVAPGTIAIERNFKTDPNYPDDWLPYIPLGRAGKVEDISDIVVFLASDKSSYITGQLIYIEGGELTYVPMPRANFARKKND